MAKSAPAKHLRCISVRQPWAELIASGTKMVENRTRRTDITGWIGIHSSKRLDTLERFADDELAAWFPAWPAHALCFGAVIAVAWLDRCCRFDDLPAGLKDHEFADDDPDNWCWVLRDPVRLLNPVPATGQASFFYVDVPNSSIPPFLLAQL